MRFGRPLFNLQMLALGWRYSAGLVREFFSLRCVWCGRFTVGCRGWRQWFCGTCESAASALKLDAGSYERQRASCGRTDIADARPFPDLHQDLSAQRVMAAL